MERKGVPGHLAHQGRRESQESQVLTDHPGRMALMV